MNTQTTLLGFLENAGLQVRIYDMGRQIQKMSRHDFEKFEQLELAYPFPVQQQAWFALCLNPVPVRQAQDSAQQPVIWFVRFPLDETGRLVPASRDYFLHRLLEARVSEAAEQPLSEAALKDNPHVFKPREDKMAIFHAILTHHLKAPPSRFYPHAQTYFSGSQGWEQWKFIGFQGIADLAVRFQEDNNQLLISTAIGQLPAQPLEALCQCLEHLPVSLSLSKALEQRLLQELASDRPAASRVSYICRAISLSGSSTTRDAILTRVLSSEIGSSPEILSAVSARCWQWLAQHAHARLYLDALAGSDQQTFNACMADLLYLPGMRNTLLKVIRDPHRADSLATKFGQFMQAVMAP